MPDLGLHEKIPNTDSPVKVMWNKIGTHKFAPHWHEHLEIHYISEGSAVMKCDEHIVELNAGDCLIVNSNELHSRIDGYSNYLCILIYPALLKNNKVVFNRKIQDPEIKMLLDKMCCEILSNDKSKDIALKGYGHLLYALLCRNFVYREFDETTYNAYSQKTIMFNEAVKYIYDNFAQNITLELMAEKAHLNKHYFCHAFKEFTGKTLKEYINDVRIEKAIELLSTTDIPITEVSFLCGFNDSNYFSRKFRQVTGQTPRSLRRKQNTSL